MPPGRASSWAFLPFHRAILAGSTKNPNTVSGVASMRTSRTTVRSASRRSASSWAMPVPPFVPGPPGAGRLLPGATPAGRRGRFLPTGHTLLPLGRTLQGVEAIGPELLEERPYLRQPLRPGSVQALRPLPALGEEPGVLQDLQVLRDGRPRHVEVRGDPARRHLPVPHQPEDLPAGWLGDRSKRGLHRGAELKSLLT